MVRFTAGLVLTAALLVPQISLARGWTVMALGTEATIESCQARAEALFAKQGSTLQTGKTGHHVVAYGLRGLDIDAAIACAASDDGRVTAAMTVHTWTNDAALDERRLQLAREIRELW